MKWGPYLVLLIAVFRLNFVQSSILKLKNVCEEPKYYNFKSISPKCHYNPDVNANLPKLLTQHDIGTTSYRVTTEDGYILKVFNIRRENPKGVVFLQHSAIMSSNCFVDKGPDSLGIAIYNAGYDVWLGNFRGSHYSRRHVRLNPNWNIRQFWNFSSHEMGIYDIPAQIDLVIEKTGAQKITFIGHGTAGLAAAIYASLQKDHAKANINRMILLAPMIFAKTSAPALKDHLWVFRMYYHLTRLTPLTEVFKQNSILHRIFKLLFSTNAKGVEYSQKRLGEISGGRKWGMIDWTQIPLLNQQLFGGTSMKTINHYVQYIGRFEKKVPYYDYGEKLNQIYYNSPDPPFYPFEQMNTSTHVIPGMTDTFAPFQDVLDFYIERLNSLDYFATDVNHNITTIQGYGHYDFLYSNALYYWVNKLVLEILSRIYPTTSDIYQLHN